MLKPSEAIWNNEWQYLNNYHYYFTQCLSSLCHGCIIPQYISPCTRGARPMSLLF